MSWKCKEEGQRPAYSYQSNKISSCVAQFLRKYCFSFSTLTSTLKVDQGRWNYYKRHNRSMQGTITQKIKNHAEINSLKNAQNMLSVWQHANVDISPQTASQSQPIYSHQRSHHFHTILPQWYIYKWKTTTSIRLIVPMQKCNQQLKVYLFTLQDLVFICLPVHLLVVALWIGLIFFFSSYNILSLLVFWINIPV